MGRLRVLIVGGGVAALEAALALRHLAEERVAIELFAPEPQFWYRPLSVVEPFDVGHVRGIELVEFADACSAPFTLGALASVDSEAHVARTVAGAEFEYDVLLLATGARPTPAVRGAFTFRGPADTDALRALLSSLEDGSRRRLVFAVPGGVTWPLPLYELALMSAARRADAVEVAFVTPEEAPLAVFGSEAGAAVSALLAERRITVHAGRTPVGFEDGTLTLSPRRGLRADRVVALPRLDREPIPGIPHDARGFVPVDSSSRVMGIDDVFAAGDMTSFPVKQGGLAAQQAVAAAEAIAAQAGTDVDPQPFRPVLRAVLLTGGAPLFLCAELTAGGVSTAQIEPLWWPPDKIVGRHLAPFLAERAELVLTPAVTAEAPAVPADASAAGPRR